MSCSEVEARWMRWAKSSSTSSTTASALGSLASISGPPSAEPCGADIGVGIEAGEAEGETQPVGAGLAGGLGLGEQAILVQPDGAHTLDRRGVVGDLQRLERGGGGRVAAHLADDAGQGLVAVDRRSRPGPPPSRRRR